MGTITNGPTTTENHPRINTILFPLRSHRVLHNQTRHLIEKNVTIELSKLSPMKFKGVQSSSLLTLPFVCLPAYLPFLLAVGILHVTAAAAKENTPNEA